MVFFIWCFNGIDGWICIFFFFGWNGYCRKGYRLFVVIMLVGLVLFLMGVWWRMWINVVFGSNWRNNVVMGIWGNLWVDRRIV